MSAQAVSFSCKTQNIATPRQIVSHLLGSGDYRVIWLSSGGKAQRECRGRASEARQETTTAMTLQLPLRQIKRPRLLPVLERENEETCLFGGTLKSLLLLQLRLTLMSWKDDVIYQNIHIIYPFSSNRHKVKQSHKFLFRVSWNIKGRQNLASSSWHLQSFNISKFPSNVLIQTYKV